MLAHTFIHIPGIGPRTEQQLWGCGIRSWNDADRIERCSGIISAHLQKKLDDYIPRSRAAIRDRDAKFFERLSPLGESWRAFPEFADHCIYLDIETTGLSTVFDSITMVGLYDGRRYKVFVEGENLEDLPAELQKYSVVVTFNGSGFDLRFLKLAFPNMIFPPIHIDLRWVTRKLGLRGGLKEIEAKLKIFRPDSLKGLDGYDATVLWSKYLRGDKSALDQLISYNTEDVVNLRAIMEIAYDKLSQRTAALQGTAVTPLFSNLSAIPRARKHREIKKLDQTKSSTAIVGGLLEKCGKVPRIVGIDLTGSERRLTGWSLLNGAIATTKTIRTDDELVRETIAARADVVSIDSPLSVPEACTNPLIDGNWPIYRKCELALKRMGISVFWCLLPSMKSLTIRGIKLASALRNAGLTVIESYPGAAQDLLGIPRKGSSLEELKWGLRRAGITGAYLTAHVTHDEVDAITSALVGLFYLANDYIALGTSSEDYLIVPRTPRINYTKLDEILSLTGLDSLYATNRPC